jgi:type IV secretory pathway VirB10-like protein
MRAHDGPMPRRAPGWPLAATLGAHLLLAWFWLAGATRRPEIEDPAERVFTLLPVPRPRAAIPPPAPPRPAPSRPSDKRAPPEAPPPADRPVESIPVQQPPAQRFPEAYDDPLAERRDAQAPAAPDSGMAAQARRQAGPADHALRQGGLAPLAPKETRWQRFAERLEAAHKDSARTLASESYTTPDGVTIYRFRRGGKVYCRTGGSVRPTPSALDYVRDRGGAVQFDSGGGEGSAGLIPCPKYAEFKRD